MVTSTGSLPTAVRHARGPIAWQAASVRISLCGCGSVEHSLCPWRCRLTWSRRCPLLLGSAITTCARLGVYLDPAVISPGREAHACRKHPR
jgi:hypothetical protein